MAPRPRNQTTPSTAIQIAAISRPSPSRASSLCHQSAPTLGSKRIDHAPNPIAPSQGSGFRFPTAKSTDMIVGKAYVADDVVGAKFLEETDALSRRERGVGLEVLGPEEEG